MCWSAGSWRRPRRGLTGGGSKQEPLPGAPGSSSHQPAEERGSTQHSVTGALQSYLYVPGKIIDTPAVLMLVDSFY